MPDPLDNVLRARIPNWDSYPPSVKAEFIRRARATIAARSGAPAPSALGRTSTGKPEMTEIQRRAKMSDQAQQIIALTKEMQDLYQKRLKPKFESGQLSNFGQGLRYVYPGYFSDKVDPDVEKWMVKSGQLAQLTNAYYSASSAGRGGVGQYQVITKPHIPTPPAELLDLTGSPGFVGEGKRQWNLEQQATWLPEIQHYVDLQEKLSHSQPAQLETFEPYNPPSAGGPAPSEGDPYGLRKHGIGP